MSPCYVKWPSLLAVVDVVSAVTVSDTRRGSSSVRCTVPDRRAIAASAPRSLSLFVIRYSLGCRRAPDMRRVLIGDRCAAPRVSRRDARLCCERGRADVRVVLLTRRLTALLQVSAESRRRRVDDGARCRSRPRIATDRDSTVIG